MRFEQIGGGDDFATNDFLQHVDFAAAESVVQMDSRHADGVFRLAETATLASGSTLRAAAVAQSAVLSVGTLTIGETASFEAEEGTAIRLDAVVGEPKQVNLAGGTFELTGLPDRKDWAGAELHLSEGARVKLPANGVLRVHDVYLDGVKQSDTLFAPDNASWVLSGKVVTRAGTILILR